MWGCCLFQCLKFRLSDDGRIELFAPMVNQTGITVQNADAYKICKYLSSPSIFIGYGVPSDVFVRPSGGTSRRMWLFSEVQPVTDGCSGLGACEKGQQ